MTVAVRLRPLRRADLDAVAELERRDGQGSWTRGMFADELERPADRRYLVGVVAGDGGERVVAHGGVMIVADEAHVTTLAVEAGLRRRGVATRVVRTLLRAAAERGAVAATLEVRASNDGARALYRRLGFEPEGVRPRYYRDTGEDAVVMWCRRLPGTGPHE